MSIVKGCVSSNRISPVVQDMATFVVFGMVGLVAAGLFSHRWQRRVVAEALVKLHSVGAVALRLLMTCCIRRAYSFTAQPCMGRFYTRATSNLFRWFAHLKTLLELSRSLIRSSARSGCDQQ
jgi:hypothetical protein